MSDEHGITQENLLSALPAVLKEDANMFAHASGAAEVLCARAAEVGVAEIYTRLGCLQEGLLDILAHDFHIDWWDPDHSLAQKREAFKESWRMHRMLGTKVAAELGIALDYRGAKVVEWPEFGGQPHTYRLVLDAAYEGIDPKKHKRVLDRMEIYKRFSSEMEAVEYVAHPQGICTARPAAASVGAAIEFTVGVFVYGVG